MRILDIGAYIGDTALLYAQGGAEEVYAVEPSPANLALLERNIAQNPWKDRIHILPVAIADKQCVVSLTMHGLHPDSDHLSNWEPAQAGLPSLNENVQQVQVPAWTFEQLIEHTGWEEIDLVKIDCEGAEYPILSSTRPDFIRRVKTYYVEYHHGPQNLIKYWKRSVIRYS